MFRSISSPLGRLRAFLFEHLHRIGHAYATYRNRFLLLAVKTNVDLPSDFCFDESRATHRGRQAPDGKHYSSTYDLNWNDIPVAIKIEIRNFDTVLRLYFGGDYLINTANVWRNVGIPDEYRALDIYSQVWHYDHVVDYRNVQLFCLLSDTTDQHGPFEYLANASQTELNLDVEARNGAEFANADIAKLVGLRGDGVWFSTGATPHRAGIPKFGLHRDIFSIAFFPKHTKIGVSAEKLLALGDDA